MSKRALGPSTIRIPNVVRGSKGKNHLFPRTSTTKVNPEGSPPFRKGGKSSATSVRDISGKSFSLGSGNSSAKSGGSNTTATSRRQAQLATLNVGYQPGSTSTGLSLSHHRLFFLPDISKWSEAPEIQHLKLSFGEGEEVEEEETGSSFWSLMSSRKNDKLRGSSTTMFGEFFRKLVNLCCPRKGKRKTKGGIATDDLKPLHPRTRRSLTYVQRLANEVGDEESPKAEGYNALYAALCKIDGINTLYLQLVLVLTYSRYSEIPLTQEEIDMTQYHTIIGSLTWLATFILEQIQYDSDIVNTGYPAKEVEAVLVLYQKAVATSIQVWRACVKTVEAVEATHNRVEQVFTSLLKGPKAKKEVQQQHSRHLRTYGKKKNKLDKVLDKSKRSSFSTVFRHHHHFMLSFSPPRILYKDFKRALAGWKGFDLLSQDKKFIIIRMLLSDVDRILSLTLREMENSVHQALKGNISKLIDQAENALKMQKDLSEDELLEVERIMVDHLDLLTLGTGTLRTLLHDGRHIIHVCYELTRELDYVECRKLISYEELALRVVTVEHGLIQAPEVLKDLGKKLVLVDEAKSKQLLAASKQSSAATSKASKGRLSSLFDIEERTLDQRDVDAQFDSSIYQEIIKEVPVRTNNLTLGLTLQDIENVFTDSSHALLNHVNPMPGNL